MGANDETFVQDQRDADRIVAMMRLLPSGFLILSRNGNILQTNPACAALLSDNGQNVIDTSFSGYITIEERENFVHFLDGLFEAGSSRQCQLTLKSNTGKTKSVTFVAVPTANGQECCAVLAEVAERKKPSDPNDVSQKIQTIGQIASGIAHDFNNLLTVIHGNATCLQQNFLPSDPNYSLILEICDAAAHGSYLTKQMVAFSHRQILRPTLFDLNELVAENQPFLARLVGPEIAIEMQLGTGVHRVWAEPGQVWQVLTCLVLQARGAVLPGQSIRICTSKAVLPSDAQEHCVPEGDLQTDLRRFTLLSVAYQSPPASGAVTTALDGSSVANDVVATKDFDFTSGAGLATAMSVLNRMGGSYVKRIDETDGTMLMAYLPQVEKFVAQPVKADEPRILPAKTESHQRPATVLLIEDNDALRRLLQEVLSKANFQVLSAPSSEQALHFALNRSQEIDLLVSDIVLPGMPGFEFVELIRKFRPQIRILAMSGYVSAPESLSSIPSTHFAYLRKPFSTAVLVACARRLLQSSPV